MPHESFLRGGLNASAIQRSFGIAPMHTEDHAGYDKHIRRAFTRELKQAGIKYALNTWIGATNTKAGH